MRKLVLLAIIIASLSLPLCKLMSVRAGTQITSIYDVQLGMNVGEVLAGLTGKYSIVSSTLSEGLVHYSITGGTDHRFDYEIFAFKGKVISVWTNDAKSYSGDADIVGTELFDALYTRGQPRHDKFGEAMGVRSLNVSVELQKPADDSSSRTLIFELTGEDFRLSFLNEPNGRPSLLVQRVKALDEKAMHKLDPSP